MVRDRLLCQVRIPSVTIDVHLIKQSVILRSKALVLSSSDVEVLCNLTQLTLCMLIGLEAVLQSLDVLRR